MTSRADLQSESTMMPSELAIFVRVSGTRHELASQPRSDTLTTWLPWPHTSGVTNEGRKKRLVLGTFRSERMRVLYRSREDDLYLLCPGLLPSVPKRKGGPA
ncbi:hypothetical protein TNCV_2613591 [Trichonephila clavipes]|nr:hypothetical protein TNCV_2613591 [Trichonephila clavipes]